MTFGAKVIGQDAYDKAVRTQKGGAAVFGVRVRGAIPEDGPTNTAKRLVEHGPRVVVGATGQNQKGEAAEGVSVEDLDKILADNPTYFDSLFENELAREDGPRAKALKIFQKVETGIKGAGRRDVLDDIARLLGEQPLRSGAGAQADLIKAQRKQVEQQVARQDRNQAAAQEEIEVPATTEQQVAKIEEEDKTDDKSETDGKTDIKPGSTDFEAKTVAELEEYLGEEVANVRGSGSGGGVVKADLVRAARRHERKLAVK